MSKDLPKGLTSQKAHELLKEHGFNELPSQKRQSSLDIMFKVLSEPMLFLLLASGLIYLFLGEINDALMLLSFIIVVLGITFYQENKTEKTLHELRNLASPRALVIRDGEKNIIPGRDVVIGDIVVLQEGDRVPADATLLNGSNIMIDESILTGESLPVSKAIWDGKMSHQRPGGDNLPFLFSGTMIVSGYGLAKVTATGINTEIGKIGKSLQNIQEEETLLKKEISRIVKYFLTIGLILCALILFFYYFYKGDLINGFLYGLAVSMSMLPEEFPVVLAIFMTIGAWRMSKRNVLARRPAVIETLGAATVLCVDKTGTLTENKMQLESVFVDNKLIKLTKATVKNQAENILTIARLASREDSNDPIEKEVVLSSNHFEIELDPEKKLIKEYHLTKQIIILSHVWETPTSDDYLVCAKGAPEWIMQTCDLSAQEKETIVLQIQDMAKNGYRILGVAQAKHKKDLPLPEDQNDFDFEFVGLLGFFDPVKPSVEDALKEAYEAGIRVIMITGDYPGTAQFVAKKIGLNNSENYITGLELSEMDHLQLRERIKTANIFARVLPEQKLDIIKALKANGEIVAMTGDGVNDAPALKAAHIGIAMGKRGTDVAREASSLVLLDDEFCSIVDAVKMGRRIFDNLKKAVAYIFSIHIPIAGMAFLPIVFNLPTVLLPAHIAFLELIIDPACSTVFEAQEPDKNLMKRKPRNLKRPMFDLKSASISSLQGLSALLVTAGLFWWATKTGRSPEEARTFAFVSLVFSNLMLIAINLSWNQNIFKSLFSENKVWLIIFGGALTFLTMILNTPFLLDVFHLSRLSFMEAGFIGLIVFGSLVWFEVFKAFGYKKYLA